MAFDTKYVYTFGIAEGASPVPRTTCYGNLVTMYIDPNTPGNFAHEIKHGGQLALGMYKINGEFGGEGYRPIIEMQAYQAQYAYAGIIEYFTYSNVFELAMSAKVTKFMSITDEFVKSIL